MTSTGNRLRSAIVAAAIQGALGYALIVGLAYSMRQDELNRLAAVNLTPEPPPLPESPPPKTSSQLPRIAVAPIITEPAAKGQWATANAKARERAFVEIRKWRDSNLSDEERRAAQWRKEAPQGTGPAEVTRLRPPNLTTHTVYWPAKWTKGSLPVIAWGNDHAGQCSNSSLPYAAFLSEIASHGYFVVAVGNDDIDYPQPEGLAFLADGRPLRTRSSALTRAVDWAVAENGRAGSPYEGRLDTTRIAYMGHGCGAGQALAASSDPRTTTTVLLNSSASFRPDPSSTHMAPIAHFEGERDDSAVIEAGDANFARAQAASWPMYKAALKGLNHVDAYPGPDRRWSRAVLAWLDWQLKGNIKAGATLAGLLRAGWSRIGATSIAVSGSPDAR